MGYFLIKKMFYHSKTYTIIDSSCYTKYILHWSRGQLQSFFRVSKSKFGKTVGQSGAQYLSLPRSQALSLIPSLKGSASTYHIHEANFLFWNIDIFICKGGIGWKFTHNTSKVQKPKNVFLCCSKHISFCSWVLFPLMTGLKELLELSN